MKWCCRLEQRVVTSRVELTSELIFVEAIDCLCACLPIKAGRLQLMSEIGKRLNISHNEVCHRLQFASTHTNVCVV